MPPSDQSRARDALRRTCAVRALGRLGGRKMGWRVRGFQHGAADRHTGRSAPYSSCHHRPRNCHPHHTRVRRRYRNRPRRCRRYPARPKMKKKKREEEERKRSGPSPRPATHSSTGVGPLVLPPASRRRCRRRRRRPLLHKAWGTQVKRSSCGALSGARVDPLWRPLLRDDNDHATRKASGWSCLPVLRNHSIHSLFNKYTRLANTPLCHRPISAHVTLDLDALAPTHTHVTLGLTHASQ